MKIVELISFLKSEEKLEEFCKVYDLIQNSECILIYMKEKIDIDSDIFFFAIEDTEDNIKFIKEDIVYIQLFPLFYASELITLDLDLLNKGFDNLEIAQRLIEYRVKDS
jgi:effector-binding domain-containing protein